jgi:siroheme synthase (precorrin-2 oxidase/ferrochelatase)
MTFQAKNIIDPDKLFQMATEFQPVIAMQISTDDTQALSERANHIASIMATTGKMLADAKYWRDKAVKDSVLTQLKDAKRSSLPASVMNELIKAECKDYNYLVNWIEQEDKDCKYQIELLRSLISLRKTEMTTFNQ